MDLIKLKCTNKKTSTLQEIIELIGPDSFKMKGLTPRSIFMPQVNHQIFDDYNRDNPSMRNTPKLIQTERNWMNTVENLSMEKIN